MKNINNENKIIFSICIPTYNRSFYLVDTLKDLTDQYIEDPSLMKVTEIVVSDNNSQDDTKDIVTNFQKKFENIKYFKNEKNVGFDLNVINSVKKARGEYCMYLGDDDTIAIGGIRLLVDYLNINKPVVLTYELEDYLHLKDSRLSAKDLTKDVIYSTTSHNDFYMKGYSIGVFSYFIFKRDLWLQSAEPNTSVDGWLYHDVILKMSALDKGLLTHISLPISYAKQDSPWSKDGGELYALISYKKQAEQWLTYNYDKSIFEKELSVMPRRLILILLRAKGRDLAISKQNYKAMYDSFRKNYFYLSIASIIFIVPNWIIKLTRDFNKKVTKIKT